MHSRSHIRSKQQAPEDAPPATARDAEQTSQPGNLSPEAALSSQSALGNAGVLELIRNNIDNNTSIDTDAMDADSPLGDRLAQLPPDGGQPGGDPAEETPPPEGALLGERIGPDAISAIATSGPQTAQLLSELNPQELATLGEHILHPSTADAEPEEGLEAPTEQALEPTLSEGEPEDAQKGQDSGAEPPDVEGLRQLASAVDASELEAVSGLTSLNLTAGDIEPLEGLTAGEWATDASQAAIADLGAQGAPPELVGALGELSAEAPPPQLMEGLELLAEARLSDAQLQSVVRLHAKGVGAEAMQHLAQMDAPERGATRQELPFQGELERAFGETLGDVSVIRGEAADPLLAQQGAEAMAIGPDRLILPANPTRELLAHEVAHLIQARRTGSRADPTTRAGAGDAAEQEAERAAQAVRVGKKPEISATPGAAVAMKEGDPIGPGSDLSRSAAGQVQRILPGGSWGNVGADFATDVIPFMSNVKDAIVAISGVNPITGEKAGALERILAGVGAIPVVGNVVKVGSKVGKGVFKLAKWTGKWGWDALKWTAKVGKTAWSKARSLGGKAWSGIRSMGSKAWRGLSSLSTRAWSGIRSMGSRAWGGLKSMGSRAWGGLKSMGAQAWSGLKRVGAGLDRVLSRAGRGAWRGLKSLTTKGWRGLTAMGSKAMGGLRRLGGKVWGGLKGIGARVSGGLRSAWSGLGSLATKGLRGITRIGGRGLRGLANIGAKGLKGLVGIGAKGWSALRSLGSKTRSGLGWLADQARTGARWLQEKRVVKTWNKWNSGWRGVATNTVKHLVFSQQTQDKLRPAVEWAGEKAGELWSGVKERLRSLGESAKEGGGAIRSAGSAAMSGVRSAASATWEGAKSAGSAVVSGAQSLGQRVGGFLSRVF